ncbi:penicillin-binding transpeptidase domain-containing protein [Paenarthrobacter aurescens]|jgi:cell division protein FtsW (lipid II flippase)|uniref:Penicillin binding protein transpeptidase domain n=1 Tax=Paenarthrobacter aurescens (strain TC1) TaxID=290340 RepID=A1R9G9_PAEAT|nr:penicillin-binding transpeptidase domain-containing protein [Paenarthrobacter aurescens]ABM08909.1 Penicillin binding protein transpeptidase domain [Paenarthrobacter aurescens TC1]
MNGPSLASPRATSTQGAAKRRATIPAVVLQGAIPFSVFWILADVDDGSRILGAMALGLCAAVCGAVAKPTRYLVAVVWGVTAVGIAIQLRLGADLGTMLTFAVASALLFVGASAVLPRILRHFRAPEKLARLGQLALGAALLLRLIPGLQGHINSGQLAIGSFSLQLGEFSRILAIAGVGLIGWSTLGTLGLRRLFRSESKASSIGLILLAGNLGLLAVVDTGPAIVLTAAAAVMVVASVARIRPILRRIEVWLTAGAIVFLSVSFAAQFNVLDRLETRWSNVSTPDEQLAAALRAAQGGGLIGHGVGTSPLAGHIPVAASDFVPAVVAADLGYLALGAITAALLCCYGIMLSRISRGRTPLAIMGIGVLTALLVQTVITVLGSMGAIPLTGLSTPALAATGSTMLSTFIALGIASAAVREMTAVEPAGRPPTVAPPRAVLGISAGIVAYLCALAVLPIDTSLQGLYLARGDIRTADGAIIASTDSDGERVYPSGGLYSDVGLVVRGYADYGVESMYRSELTCGGPANPLDVLLGLFRQPACVPADIETTLQSPLQKAIKEAAGDSSAQVVVTDSMSGSILALYSSRQKDPADVSAGTAPEAPSRLKSSPPGSTFKVVVAAAALLNDVDADGARTDVVKANGAELTNSRNLECPDTSIATMLAFSCNTTAGYLALHVGQPELNRVAEEYFGANMLTRFDGGDVAPLTLAQEDTSLSAPQLMRTGIGQESVQSSPLAMNAATAVIAHSALSTDGSATPALHLVASVCSGTPAVTAATTFGKALPAPVATEILRGMRQAAEVGTATHLGKAGHSLGRDIAAKSGTAEVSIPGSAAALDSWVTAIIDGRWIITARVQNSTAAQANNAQEIAARILPLIPRSNISYKTPCS